MTTRPYVDDMTRLRLCPLTLVAVAILTGGLLESCSSKDSQPPDVTLTLKETSIRSTIDTLEGGKLRVTAKNEGSVVHEFVAFRTDLEEGSLPMTSQGDRVDEGGAGITHLDPEAEDVSPGKSKTITLDLPAGRYVFACNLPGHYSLGMHTVITAT